MENKIQLKKGDYVKVTKIGCYGEYISYISIVDKYDEENNVLYEIISCLERNNNEEFEVLFYNSTSESIINICEATKTEKDWLNELIKDLDNNYFDFTDLTIKSYE